MNPTPNKWMARAAMMVLLALTLAADQWTKLQARIHFGLPGGEPDYFKVKPILGEWLQFRLIYNTGAAFGMRPQHLFPWLNPTVFYLMFSTVAIVFLGYLYRRVPRGDNWQKAGIVLILSGAFGNLIDRMRFDRVTDFIDVGIPAYTWRWPTFNVADSCVCVGVAMLVLVSRRPGPPARKNIDLAEATEAPEGPPPTAPAADGTAPQPSPAPQPGSFPDPNP